MNDSRSDDDDDGHRIVRQAERNVTSAELNQINSASSSSSSSASASASASSGAESRNSSVQRGRKRATGATVGTEGDYVFQCTLYALEEDSDVCEKHRVEVLIHLRPTTTRSSQAQAQAQKKKAKTATKAAAASSKAAGGAVVPQKESDTLVGTLRGYLISRPSSRFYDTCDEIGEALLELACLFCERSGAASLSHPSLARDSPRAVSSGGFLYIDTVEVQEEHRGKDLGLYAVHEALVFLEDLWSLAVMQPDALNYGDWFDPYKAPDAAAIAKAAKGRLSVQRHFARMGFVQAGRSLDTLLAFFLTAEMYFQRRGKSSRAAGQLSDPDAAIERWIPKADAERTIDIYSPPPRHEITGLDAELGRFVEAILSSKCFDPSAFQSIIRRGATVDGARALHICAAADSQAKTVMLQVFAELERSGGDVNLADAEGNQPLHAAAARKNHVAIKWLLNHGANRAGRNTEEETPLDVLVREYRSSLQTFGLARSHPRKIDVARRLKCIQRLMGWEAKRLHTDGWLSPRMRKMLLITAELEADLFDELRPEFDNYLPLPLSECCCPDGVQRIEYIPLHVIQSNPGGFFGSFYDGYGSCFRAIWFVLKCRRAPTVQNVREALNVMGCDRRKVQHFYAKGGQVEYALDAVLDITENVLGDGEDGWGYETFRDKLESLPSSPFDDMIDLARFMCINRGGGNLQVRGPHRDVMLYQDSDDDADDDEDEDDW